MAKRVCSIKVLVVLLIHLAGFYAYFFVRLVDLRMTMREKLVELPAEQLNIVRVPKDQFKATWLEEREMKWQGRMYDIARVQPDSNDLLVYCLHDKDEDGLLSFLSAVVDLGQQEIPEIPFSVIQFNLLEYELQAIDLPGLLATALPSPSGRYLFALSSLKADPLSPPPRA